MVSFVFVDVWPLDLLISALATVVQVVTVDKALCPANPGCGY